METGTRLRDTPLAALSLAHDRARCCRRERVAMRAREASGGPEAGFGMRWQRRLLALGLVLPLLSGCGGQVGAATARATGAPLASPSPTIASYVTPSVTPSPAATAEQPVGQAGQTATTSSRPPASTSTPVTAPTTAAVPTSTTSSAALPEATATPPPVVVDLSKWPIGVAGTPYPARTTYDAATGRYIVALSEPGQGYDREVYLPDNRVFDNLAIAVDAQGADASSADGYYGIRFRVQPRGANDLADTGFNFLVDPRHQEFRVTWTAPNDRATVIGKGTSTAIKTDNAVNHLKVTCQGDRIVASVNGETLGSYEASYAARGSVGLVVVNLPNPNGTAAMQASFSNLTISPVPPR